ncbi:Immunoglobulin lambda variable 5-45 [Varanus komodoensis]|nr:Immunoglobulin lambda variable 5-45 [Varanus komodoensis]
MDLHVRSFLCFGEFKRAAAGGKHVQVDDSSFANCKIYRQLTMSSQALFLLVLLSYCSGVMAQPTLTQPASQAASPGETAKLSCTISSNPSTIGWVQQKAGQAPHFVHCDGCSSRGPGIPNRFTASRSGNMGYLTISSLQAEDEADYYCYMWYSSGRVFHDGVSSQPTLTQPASQSVSLGQTVKLTCTISSNPNNVGWYQERSGQGPRYVHADGSSRGEGIPDRFTASRSGSTGYLTITNAQAEDEAVYYCGMRYSKMFHSGTF